MLALLLEDELLIALEALKMAASDSAKPLAIDETIKFIVRDWLITHGYLIVPPDVEWKDDLT